MFVLWLTGCKEVIYQCALLFVSASTKWQKTKKEDDPLSVFTVTSSSLPLYNHSSHGADYSQDHLTLHIMHWSFPLTVLHQVSQQWRWLAWTSYPHNGPLGGAVNSHLTGCQVDWVAFLPLAPAVERGSMFCWTAGINWHTLSFSSHQISPKVFWGHTWTKKPFCFWQILNQTSLTSNLNTEPKGYLIS